MSAAHFFSEADRADIARAVRDAEKRTSGEIVVSVVPGCGGYSHAVWKAALLGSLAATLGAAVAQPLVEVWGWLGHVILFRTTPALAGAAVGWASVAALPALRRLLATPEALEDCVRLRARAAFLEHEVFHTAERTGILLFLALFERRVVLLADSGISARVEQHEWDDIVAGVTAGLRTRNAGPALVVAIGRCGDLLAKHGFLARPGDRDELPNEMHLDESEPR